MRQVERKLRAILKETGWTQNELADRLEVTQASVSRWLSGGDPRGEQRDKITDIYNELFKTDSGSVINHVPIMGYIGAGAEIYVDVEQVPPDGLDSVEIPFPLPAEMIAFRVQGDSMLPAYKDGYVLVIHKEQTKPLEYFFGKDAAVKTLDGRRFIKTLMRGMDGVNLISWNAAPMENIKLEWEGEIFAILPR